MPIALFEILCVLVVVTTLTTLARSRPLPQLAAEYAALAAAAWLGEESSIAAYRFYAYADAWHLRLLDVPVLVPLIWPLVILSARDVARALAPELGRGEAAREARPVEGELRRGRDQHEQLADADDARREARRQHRAG